MMLRDEELLAELRGDPELLAIADALGEALRPRRRPRVVLLLALLAVAVASAIGLIVANASAEKHGYDGPGITPSNLSALTSESTRLAGIPDDLSGRTGSLAPRPASVHVLGAGVAYAWITTSGRICMSALLTGGCLDALKEPIDIVGADPDVIGGGDPGQVYGIAGDDVASVTVRLDDGRSVTADVVDNFYVVTLPDGVEACAPMSVVANLRDGNAISKRLAGSFQPAHPGTPARC